MTLTFAHSKFNAIVDLKTGKLFWNLPDLACGMPLCMTSDLDKLLLSYDSNKIVIFDLINRKLHDWTVTNLSKIPKNFLTRYNRTVGVSQLSDRKYLLWSNYTYSVLDLAVEMPAEVQIVMDHPNSTIQGKHRDSESWAELVKLSQEKYLTRQAPVESKVDAQKSDNLTISNKLKGILCITLDDGKIRAVENLWKRSLKQMPGAFVTKKFHK